LVVGAQNFELDAGGQWVDVFTNPIEEKPAISQTAQAKIEKLTAAIAKAASELKTADDVMKGAHQNTLEMLRAVTLGLPEDNNLWEAANHSAPGNGTRIGSPESGTWDGKRTSVQKSERPKLNMNGPIFESRVRNARQSERRGEAHGGRTHRKPVLKGRPAKALESGSPSAPLT